MFAKKSLGQNFLIDKNIIKKITNLTKVKNRNIIEIGPGKGALTDEILKGNPKSLSIIEKDFKLFKQLLSKYSDKNNVNVINGDILKLDLDKIGKKNSVIFGNLPYNISSQILIKILRLKKWPPFFDDLILMFQKELGDKIIGKYLTSNYSRLSILSNFKLKLSEKFRVSPNCFFPKPKVNSLVLHFVPKKTLFKINKINSILKK